jgi:DNA-binding response OmpR family regulator
MTMTSDLAGCRVLVVEDDYYLATDAQIVLTRAGATVLGPSARTDEGLSLLAEQRPDCAVLDINLGSGPSFALAEALRAQEIPFLFVTGYDATMIPPQFANVERLEKPISAARLLDSVTGLCAAAKNS